MRKVSFICTFGTAFIGIANTIVTFNNNPLPQKVLSILVAAFGVILSFLKGSLFVSMLFTSSLVRISLLTLHSIGAGMPTNAFMSINKVNDIIVCRFHVVILSHTQFQHFE